MGGDSKLLYHDMLDIFSYFSLETNLDPSGMLGPWRLAVRGESRQYKQNLRRNPWLVHIGTLLIDISYIYIFTTHDIYIMLYIYIHIYVYLYMCVKYLNIEIFIIYIYMCVCLITILWHVSHWNCHLASLALEKVADDDSFVSVSNALDLTCLVGTCVLIGGGQNQNRKMAVYLSKNGDLMGFHGIFHGDWWLNNNLWWFNGRPVCELEKSLFLR